MKLKTDYNKISDTYNRRYQSNDMVEIEDSINETIKSQNHKSVIEIGCGTGRWIKNIQNRFCKVFGADLSISMLREIHKVSKAKSITPLICCNANFLPFQNESFDFIFMVNAIHHFHDKKSFLIEAKKILKKGGQISIYGVDPREKNDNWYIYKYFKNTYKTDLLRFPSTEEIINYLNEIGYNNVSHEEVVKINKDRFGVEVFEDPFLEKNGTSQLVLLSDEEYKTGIEKIKFKIENDKKQNLITFFPTQITFNKITAFVK